MRYPYSFAFHVNANDLFKLEAKPGKKVELSATCFVFTKTRRVFKLSLFLVCLFSFMFSIVLCLAPKTTGLHGFTCTDLQLTFTCSK